MATMTKEERLQTSEVYTVGFVPSYDLPDGQPKSLDPFLEPLISDIEAGFIDYRASCLPLDVNSMGYWKGTDCLELL